MLNWGGRCEISVLLHKLDNLVLLTYKVIMVIIAKFFSATGTSAAELMGAILSGDVFAADLNEDNLAQITLISSVVLVYVLNFIYDQIPEVTKMVLSAFDVSEEHKMGDQLADDAMRLTTDVVQAATKIAKTVLSGGDASKKDDKGGAK